MQLKNSDLGLATLIMVVTAQCDCLSAAGKRKKGLATSFKRRHEWSEKSETKKPFSQQGFRQADSGGNSRKPLTNHSIVVIYLQGWATDSSELALTLFPFLSPIPTPPSLFLYPSQQPSAAAAFACTKQHDRSMPDSKIKGKGYSPISVGFHAPLPLVFI